MMNYAAVFKFEIVGIFRNTQFCEVEREGTYALKNLWGLMFPVSVKAWVSKMAKRLVNLKS